jgi:hypothetical protein
MTLYFSDSAEFVLIDCIFENELPQNIYSSSNVLVDIPIDRSVYSNNQQSVCVQMLPCPTVTFSPSPTPSSGFQISTIFEETQGVVTFVLLRSQFFDSAPGTASISIISPSSHLVVTSIVDNSGILDISPEQLSSRIQESKFSKSSFLIESDFNELDSTIVASQLLPHQSSETPDTRGVGANSGLIIASTLAAVLLLAGLLIFLVLYRRRQKAALDDRSNESDGAQLPTEISSFHTVCHDIGTFENPDTSSGDSLNGSEFENIDEARSPIKGDTD